MCPSWEEPRGDLLQRIIRCISHWSLVDALVFCSSNTWEAASLIKFALEESVSAASISYMLQLLLSRRVPEESQDASPWGTHSSRHSAQDTWATLWVRGIEANIRCFWVLHTHTIHKNSVLLILQGKKQKGCITHPKLHGQPGWSRARIWIPFFLKTKSTVFLPNTERPSIGRKWCSWPHLFLCWVFIAVHRLALVADWGRLSSGTWASRCKDFSCCSSQL